MIEKTKVYIDIDYTGNIIKIFSTDFEQPTATSIYIDEGYGDKFRHAQTCYLEKPLINKYGNYNYQYLGGKIIDRGI